MKTIKETIIDLIESGNTNELCRTLQSLKLRFKARVYVLLDLEEQKRRLYLISDLTENEDLLILIDGMMNNEAEYVSEEPWVTTEVARWYTETSFRPSVTYDMYCYMCSYRMKMSNSGKVCPTYSFVLLDSILLNKDEFIRDWSEIGITVCDRFRFQDDLIDGAKQGNFLAGKGKKLPTPEYYYKFLLGDNNDEDNDDDIEMTAEPVPMAVNEPDEKVEEPQLNSQQNSEKDGCYEIDIIDMVGEDSDFYEVTPFDKRFDPPACKVYRPIQRPLDKLEKLVGLEKVKSTIDKFSALAKYYARISELKPEFKKPDMNKHALFLGNPGTAKTTVGNIWASILYNNGIISTGRTIVCSRETFIGRLYGDAERRWKQVIKLARQGGLLYIDEAYLMAPPEDPKDPGHSIIQYILKAVDEYPDMCIVLAGYPDKIMNMLKINPGLSSRFSLQLEFDDLDVTQLEVVTNMELERRGYKIPADTKERIKEVIAIMYANKDYSWSNARECHNLVQQVIFKVATRVMKCASPSIESMFTLIPDDIVPPEKYVISHNESPRSRIGFR